MHTTNKPNTTANRHAVGDDLGQLRDKERTKRHGYRGKYPERIGTISGGFRDGAWHSTVMTNSGAVFEFVNRHRLAKGPELGQEIEIWILHLEPINEAAEQIALKYL